MIAIYSYGLGFRARVNLSSVIPAQFRVCGVQGFEGLEPWVLKGSGFSPVLAGARQKWFACRVGGRNSQGSSWGLGSQAG